MSLILGINLSHHRSACLARDGKILVAIEEERLDRRRFSPGFVFSGTLEAFSRVSPMKSVTYCFDTVGIGIDEVDLVLGNKAAEDTSLQLLRDELPIKDKTKIATLPMPSHHLAHAYSTYFCSPFEESAILIVDGWGSYLAGKGCLESESCFFAQGNQLGKVFSRTRCGAQLSLGLFYDFFSSQLGFCSPYIREGFGSFGSGFAEPGKTMGLAAFGHPKKSWSQLISFHNGSIDIDYRHLSTQFLAWKAMEQPQLERSKEIPAYEQTFWQDIAYKAQLELEEALVYLANQAFEKTRCPNLCLAGGVALNLLANSKILTRTPFKRIFIQPASHDAGTAIGCAHYGYYRLQNGKNRCPLESAALGREYTGDEIRIVLDGEVNLCWRKTERGEVARLLSQGEIVGWFQGRSEFGPRALGRRSILADPRSPCVKEMLNSRVKQREPFRPYAPSVLAELANDFFELPCSSPFMLLAGMVRRDKRAVIPGVTHVDGSARVHTVTKEENPSFYRLIDEFRLLTGIPILLNTSFNLPGEPIVETPSDALSTFMRTDLSCVVIRDYLIYKEGKL